MPSRKDLANAIRALSMDAVQTANSGHPGAPLGMADIAEVLFNDFLRHNPANPQWPNRDRFILSNGHGSMLLYSLLHLTGYDLSLADLKQFRQLESRTPGHPEFGYTPGVETTTGPLGQGITNAVGMAIAEKTLAAQFNRADHHIVDHTTYAFLGDGCLMEGISHEACSLAGTLGLGKLIAFYDDNGISIDGEVQGWFTDDTPQRFAAYGWQVIADVDGHDAQAVATAIEQARTETARPSLICCKTTIGYGSPNKQGSAACHGAALGADEIALTREALGWPHAAFEIPADIAAAWDARARGQQSEADWQQRFAAYQAAYPQLAAEFQRRIAGQLPGDWQQLAQQVLQDADTAAASIATRKASLQTLNAIAPNLPELLGGSADLAESNLTLWSGAKGIRADDASGNYLYYGVREFAMSAIMNGIALHGGFLPYGATFLVFSDYARNAVRMAALMGTHSIFVYTHDSIGLGEDGPTHQPVEHTASLRLIPNLNVWRPCDAVESVACWLDAIEADGPSALLFSRQALPHQPRTAEQLAAIRRGGYILLEPAAAPEAVIIASGSEIALAVEAATELNASGRSIRVVSMPCVERFEAQDADYQEQVLPADLTARVVVEAGATGLWYKYAGSFGAVIGLDRFGESGPGASVFEHFGFTTAHLVDTVNELINA